jgi:hypothetical protein
MRLSACLPVPRDLFTTMTGTFINTSLLRGKPHLLAPKHDAN